MANPARQSDENKKQPPESQPVVLKGSLFSSLFSPPTALIRLTLALILLAVLVAVIFLTIYKISRLFTPSSPQPVSSKEPAIVNPEGKAAFKYFPQGGNAPDFRDGSNGSLAVTMERAGEQITFNWDPKVKISVVKVFDLGKIYNFKDNKLVWQIENYDPKNPKPQNQTKFITSPYELGTTPDGFFLDPNSNKELELKKEGRYSVELTGLNEKNLPTLGVYTFDY